MVPGGNKVHYAVGLLPVVFHVLEYSFTITLAFNDINIKTVLQKKSISILCQFGWEYSSLNFVP